MVRSGEGVDMLSFAVDAKDANRLLGNPRILAKNVKLGEPMRRKVGSLYESCKYNPKTHNLEARLQSRKKCLLVIRRKGTGELEKEVIRMEQKRRAGIVCMNPKSLPPISPDPVAEAFGGGGVGESQSECVGE